ncbi:MAG TPA: Vms1/Ankzf1 family peptidyl-tRNA hydrolase [Actinomycetota bacterium]|nr:Vms1/Ankzf1 family peptidyl-tRNA hydrolase [Actinomycetota bacterium]
METSEATPRGGVKAEDLAGLVQGTGPFLSVYLETRADIENAGPLTEQRWRTLRSELAEAGAPEGALANVDPAIEGAHLEGGCLFAVANEGGLLHVEHGPEAPASELSHWGSLPPLASVIRWRQDHPAHVVVLTDRTGADLHAVRFGRPDIHREAGGDDDPVRKVGPGGWSQRRFQERAETTWEENAKDVAVEVERLVSSVEAGLVVVSGDVRAVQLLKESLPDPPGATIEEVGGGGRATDGSRDELEREIEQVVDAYAARRGAELLEFFERERGQRDKAAEGARDVLQALAMSQVEILLVDDAAATMQTAWFGPEAAQVALSKDDVQGLGAEDPIEAPLTDVCIRTALLTGARIAVMPAEAGVRDGLGALLRWS